MPIHARSTLALLLLLATSAHAQDRPRDDPSMLPVVRVDDAAALQANLEKDVIVVGVCSTAQWSNTGKVLVIDFKEAERTGMNAVAFSSSKKRLDDAFGGDVGKSLAGQTLRIRGKLREYAGKGNVKAHPEITISDPSQITIVIDDKAAKP